MCPVYPRSSVPLDTTLCRVNGINGVNSKQGSVKHRASGSPNLSQVTLLTVFLCSCTKQLVSPHLFTLTTFGASVWCLDTSLALMCDAVVAVWQHAGPGALWGPSPGRVWVWFIIIPMRKEPCCVHKDSSVLTLCLLCEDNCSHLARFFQWYFLSFLILLCLFENL